MTYSRVTYVEEIQECEDIPGASLEPISYNIS